MHPRGIQLLPLLLLVLAGCAAEPPRSEAPALPESVRWEPVEGATGYSVRAFAGDHLVFEENTSDTELQLDASMARACAAFDTVDVVVRARGLQVPAQHLRIRP